MYAKLRPEFPKSINEKNRAEMVANQKYVKTIFGIRYK